MLLVTNNTHNNTQNITQQVPPALEEESTTPSLFSCYVVVDNKGSRAGSCEKTLYVANLFIGSKQSAQSSIAGQYSGELQEKKRLLKSNIWLASGKGTFLSDEVKYRGKFLSGFFHSFDRSKPVQVSVGASQNWEAFFTKGNLDGECRVLFKWRGHHKFLFSGRWHEGHLHFGHFEVGRGVVYARFTGQNIEFTDSDSEDLSKSAMFFRRSSISPRYALQLGALDLDHCEKELPNLEQGKIDQEVMRQVVSNTHMLFYTKEKMRFLDFDEELTKEGPDLEQFIKHLIEYFLGYYSRVEMAKFCMLYTKKEDNALSNQAASLCLEYQQELENILEKARALLDKGLKHLKFKLKLNEESWKEAEKAEKLKLENTFCDFLEEKRDCYSEEELGDILLEEKRRANEKLQEQLSELNELREQEEKKISSALERYSFLEHKKIEILNNELDRVQKQRCMYESGFS